MFFVIGLNVAGLVAMSDHKRELVKNKFDADTNLSNLTILKIFARLKVTFQVFCVSKPNETERFTRLYGKLILFKANTARVGPHVLIRLAEHKIFFTSCFHGALLQWFSEAKPFLLTKLEKGLIYTS